MTRDIPAHAKTSNAHCISCVSLGYAGLLCVSLRFLCVVSRFKKFRGVSHVLLLEKPNKLVPHASFGANVCSIPQALLGAAHCVLRKKEAQNPTLIVKNQSSNGQIEAMWERFGKQLSLPRSCSRKGDGDVPDGAQEPRCPVP